MVPQELNKGPCPFLFLSCDKFYPTRDRSKVTTSGFNTDPLGNTLSLPTDSIAKLKHFSKLDFQSKREVINNGRPMPELKGMLQTKGQKITRSTSHIQSQIALNMFGTSRIHLVLNLQRQLR